MVISSMLLVANVFAGSNSKSGSAGAQELLIPVGAKMIGLNGSSISTISGIEALYWNPAGTSNLSSNAQVTFFNGEIIGDISQKYFAGAFNFQDIGVFSFAIRSLDFGTIARTTEEAPDGTGDTYSPSYITTSIGYSNALTDRIKVGVTLNIISEKIIRSSATGVGIDAGIQYSNLGNINGLSFGIVLKNLGPSMKFDGPDLLRRAEENGANRGENLYKIDPSAFELPSLFQIGLGYQTSIDDLNSLSISGLFENNNYSPDTYRGSLEYSFDNMLFLRGSYVSTPNGVESNQNLFGTAFGGGIRYDLSYFILSVDYAYRDSQYFGGLNQFGMTVDF